MICCEDTPHVAAYGDDYIGRQAEVASHLASLDAEHIRDEMKHPKATYHLSFNFEEAAKSYMAREGQPWNNTEYRVDGRNDSTPLPAPPQYATIGSNGRRADTGQVLFIGFDIDSNVKADGTPGHSDGLPPAEIDRLIAKLKAVPWIQLNTSRGGSGIHGYVFLAREIFAASNAEMYLYGAAMLQRIAEEIDEPDLANKTDKAGSIMFYAAPNARGFKLIKPATELFTENIEPAIPSPRNADGRYQIDGPVELDGEHLRVLDYLKDNARKDVAKNGNIYYVHTSDLVRAHADLGLKGHFETVATGKGDETWNAFVVPRPGGYWLVGRWGNGETSWKQGSGIRFTLLNAAPMLRDFAEERTIVADARTEAYYLNLDEATEFMRLNGRELPLPGVPVFGVYATQRTGQLMLEIVVTPAAELKPPWRRVNQKRAAFIVTISEEAAKRPDPATIVRVAYATNGKGIVPYRRIHGKEWHEVTRTDAEAALSSQLGMGRDEINRYLTTDKPLRLVSEPFKPEFPRPYEWNFKTVGFDHKVSTQPGPYPTWQSILDHIGKGLNESVALDPWCRANGIKTGADYLKLWVSRMFRFPERRLPMLSLHSSEQNCGKSTFAAAHGMLMTRGGYTMPERALTGNFSYQLLGAVLCDLDDVDLTNRDSGAYAKLQPILTNSELVIEGKGTNTIQVANTTHWVHTSNIETAFPVQFGDTRFVIIEVGELEEEIAAEKLVRALMAEAPFYLHELMTMPHPAEPAGRLFLPVLDTPIKSRLMAARAAKDLGAEGQAWLGKLRELADAGKVRTLKTFAELQQLMGANGPKSGEAFGPVWRRLHAILQAEGYEVEHRKNVNGRVPAAWMIRKQ